MYSCVYIKGFIGVDYDGFYFRCLLKNSIQSDYLRIDLLCQLYIQTTVCLSLILETDENVGIEEMVDELIMFYLAGIGMLH